MAPSDDGWTVDSLDAAVELMGRGGRRAVLPMHGDSMLPLLRSGQRIAVEFSPERLERGDLLLFRQQDYLVVHRLLGPASHEDGSPVLRTRGDGRIALDPPLARGNVRGRVFAIQRDGRWWDLDRGGARAYGLALALHDLCWAAAGLVADRTQRVLARLGIGIRLVELVAVVDLALLRGAHRLLFRPLHQEVPPEAPPRAEVERTAPAGPS